MENAGRGVVEKLQELGAQSPVAICCGRGNNGGDGFVIARHLELRGIELQILLWAVPDDLTGDAKTNYEVVKRSGMAISVFERASDMSRFEQSLAGANWLVDALLGTGANGAPRPPLDAVIETINRSPARVMAVDVPSGLDCDTGEAAGAVVRADHTCTFIAPKLGFQNKAAMTLTGDVHVLDIGAPRELVDRFLAESN